ncbi:hypothetical protein ABES02_15040 [Neobacillus pocheonensis]|uniref:hypothetical protein n=1 Tax=Neobacillus pocheonensis TaxID=363869 RepID=UPI003D2901D1
MHIRHFILMGVFLGAAAFMPNNAFAEKNGVAGQPEPHNSAAQTLVLEERESPMASEKTVSVTPENVHKSQSRVVQKPVTNPGTPRPQTKPVPKSPDKVNRGIEKAAPSLDTNVKAGQSAEPAAKVKDTGQTGSAIPNAVTNKLPEVPKSLSSNRTKYDGETNSQPTGLNAKSKTFTKDTDSSVSIKTSSPLTLVQKPLIDEENKAPSNNWKIPVNIEFLNNPLQRTQSSGGQSNDVPGPGAGTTSFIVNWFDWDEYFALNLGQSYTSRQAKYCHQWINAPPSPPPKAAPFFLTFTANLATCNDN